MNYSMVSKSSSHRLEGVALKRWWQVKDFFSVKLCKPLEEDKFRNRAIQQQLMFFMTLPFGLGIYIYAAATTNKTGDWNIVWEFMLLNFCFIVALLVHLLLNLKKHLYRALEVDVTETGLELRSTFFRRTLRWDQIGDSYVNQDGDLILESSTGEEFILSAELSDFDTLSRVVEKRSPKKTAQFSYNNRVPNEYFDSFSAACLAVVIALLAVGVRPGVNMETFLPALAGSVVGCFVIAAIRQFHMRRMVRLVRLGNSSILLATSNDKKEIAWERIVSVKKLGSLFLVKTNSDWFMVAADKKEPVAARLIECQQRKLIVG